MAFAYSRPKIIKEMKNILINELINYSSTNYEATRQNALEKLLFNY
jgi:hypothetical protein